MQVLVNDLVVNYEKTGKGRTMLLIHGWADSLVSFGKLQNDLSSDYEVISVDLPGFGKTSKPSEPWGLDDYAEFINDFINKLNLSVYVYVGHSNGGAILIRGLATKKLSSDKLILLASAGIRDNNGGKKKAYKAIAKTGKVLTSVLPKSAKESIKTGYYEKIGSDYLIAPDMKETFKLVVDTDVQTDASKLSLPVLLVYGRNDEATPVQYGMTLNKLIKGSKLEILEDSGHFVHHDQLSETESLIRSFLK